VIGKQPTVAEQPPKQARWRFQLVFRRSLSPSQLPLALFLYDRHWVATATLELLESLITDPDVRHALLIEAYRDNEVGLSPPLMNTFGNPQAGSQDAEESRWPL